MYDRSSFARAKKQLEEKSALGAREAERYREVANKCSFTGQGSGFAYHPSFTVGETLYQVGRDELSKTYVLLCSSSSVQGYI